MPDNIVDYEQIPTLVVKCDLRILPDGYEWVVVINTSGYPAIIYTKIGSPQMPNEYSRFGSNRVDAENARQALLAAMDVHNS